MKYQTSILVSLLVITLTSLIFISLPNFSKQEGTTTVAIIDLNRLAKETGYSRQIATHISGLRTNLQNELTQAQETLSNTLNEKKEKFGKNPNKNQQEELDNLALNARHQLQQGQQQAVNLIQQEQNSLITQLYELLRPHAKRVANEKGMSVVLLRSDSVVFDFNPASDITDEVIAAVVEAKATFTPKTNGDQPATTPDQNEGNSVSQTGKSPSSNS